MVRPSTIAPFIFSIAPWASASEMYVTNPNPRLRPVSRSRMTLASRIAPYGSNAVRRDSSEVSQLRPPTNNFVAIPLAGCPALLGFDPTTLRAPGETPADEVGRYIG
jgi:hypothetical protein